MIVEDHFLTSTGIRILLNEIIDESEIYEAISFEGALETCASHKLDLIILDIDIPGGADADMIPQLRRIQPEVKILVCTGFDEKKYALEYIAAGASGFVSKSSERPKMRLAIETVLENKRYVSDVIQQRFLEEIYQKTNESAVSSEVSRLSTREEEIMKLILDGKWRKEIASLLRISPNTVSTYKSRIFEKMKVSTVITQVEIRNRSVKVERRLYHGASRWMVTPFECMAVNSSRWPFGP
ncbi:LuxR family two component transcriptional regulator [Dyadobacter jiangsuensis]|uniref:LuxR family two component transcriptional regulator n=1 Tax=Dyadobacter jiangsuensis TaxID=1591085 RepID=A0A2P8GC38_9BACT|nr:LuxR family two component transcriptional regulator [Dyadobacter jiangsuensis]